MFSLTYPHGYLFHYVDVLILRSLTISAILLMVPRSVESMMILPVVYSPPSEGVLHDAGKLVFHGDFARVEGHLVAVRPYLFKTRVALVEYGARAGGEQNGVEVFQPDILDRLGYGLYALPAMNPAELASFSTSAERAGRC